MIGMNSGPRGIRLYHCARTLQDSARRRMHINRFSAAFGLALIISMAKKNKAIEVISPRREIMCVRPIVQPIEKSIVEMVRQ